LPYAYLYDSFYYPAYYSYLYGAPYYGYGGVPYSGYGYRAPYYDYSYDQSYAYSPGAAAPSSAGQAAEAATPSTEETAEAAEKKLTEALDAFKDGRYFEAVELVGQAAETKYDAPQVHELLSLAMFALGDYRGAAIEAHAVVFYGHPSDWATIAGYYGADTTKYTEQLRALESSVKNKPDDAAAVFLLGYHYSMLGHKDDAIKVLTKALELAPQDVQAKKLLGALEGKEPPKENVPEKPLPGSSVELQDETAAPLEVTQSS
jgi:tetratricopeptide (TPR) repeat protein